MPSSPLLSPRATCMENNNFNRKTASCMRPKSSFVKNGRDGGLFFKTLTTIITLSWNHRLETNTQKMSYRKAQLRRTVPTWFRENGICQSVGVFVHNKSSVVSSKAISSTICQFNYYINAPCVTPILKFKSITNK